MRACRDAGGVFVIPHSFSPNAEDTMVVSGYPSVIAQKCSLAIEGRTGPGVIDEGAAGIGGAGEGEAGLKIGRIGAPIVELHVDIAGDRIEGHPLKELVLAIVDRIVIDSRGLGPLMALIGGRGDKHIHVTVGVIAPSEVEIAAALAGAGIDCDLGKTAYARDAGDFAEIGRAGFNDGSRGAEADPSIAGFGHSDPVSVMPNRIDFAVGGDGLDEPPD